MAHTPPEIFVELVTAPCIENHKKAWELLEEIQDEAGIMACYQALLETDYQYKIQHIQAYIENATGAMRTCAIRILEEFSGQERA